MNSLFRLTSFLFTWLVVFSASAVDFSKLNTTYWYDYHSPAKLNARVSQRGNTLTLLMRIQLKAAPGDSEIKWLMQDDYRSASHSEVNLKVDTLLIGEGDFRLEARFSEPEQKLLVAQINHGGQQFYFPIDLKRGRLDHPSFYPIGEKYPVINSFVGAGNVQFNEQDTLHLYQYAENFDAADPPMGSARTISPSLLIDSTFVAVGGASLRRNHFYFIQQDTLSNEGLTLYVGPAYYPSSRLLEELIEPLKYFTRNSELTRIMGSSDPKGEFDNFWLRTFGSPDLARNAIRKYYRSVSQANEQFTDYKAGWKTDRGMLYIIFGPPIEVYRDNRKEIWVYPDAKFDFRIISNLFAPSLYVLMRDKKYEDAWIERIRAFREDQ